MSGCFIRIIDKMPELKDSVDRGIARYARIKYADQAILRNKPHAWPMLIIMENQANAVLQLFFGLVSITSKLSGVVTAAEIKENKL